MDPELRKDVLDVRPRGLARDHELIGYLRRLLAARYERKHLALTWRQPAHPDQRLLVSAPPLEQVRQERTEHRGRDEDVAAGDGPDRVDELGWRAVGRQVAARATPEPLDQQALVARVCEHYHLAARRPVADEAACVAVRERGDAGADDHDRRLRRLCGRYRVLRA